MTKMEEAVGFNRPEYETLKAAAIEDGVQLVHIRRPVLNENVARFGGATVAWRRVNYNPKAKMIEIAISWCNPKDVFCRRIGSWVALNNFYEQATITLPIGSEDNSEVVNSIYTCFGNMV